MILGNLYDDFLLFSLFFFFFFIFLKMHEAWANAPSLEHKSMSLKKKIDLINVLKTMVQVMIFANKWVRHVKMLQCDEKIFFEC